MRLEALKNAPDRAGRYWVTFDDGSRLGLYRQTVEDFGLCPGLELETEQLSKLRAAAGEMSAKMRAVGVYDSFFAQDERQMQEFCDVYIRSFEELLWLPEQKLRKR